MTKIYCTTAYDQNNKPLGCCLFMSFNGIVKYLTKQSPIDNKYYVTGDGAYDITADNIGNTLTDSVKDGLACAITIKQDYGVITETKYTISILMVND